MNKMARRMIALLGVSWLGLSLIAAPAFAWGKTGHRVTGAIAERYLSQEARAAISALIGTESLAQASSWPDEMRSDPDPFWQDVAGPFHYVTVPKGTSYHVKNAPQSGDSFTALAQFSKDLTDPETSLAIKQRALRFIVHIIGDLHQPLHVGNGTDRGGNDVKLTWFRKESNLHRVWDSEMIDGELLSYSEWTAWLTAPLSDADVTALMISDPKIWIAESAAIRPGLYPDTSELSYDYLYQNMPIVKDQLTKGGLRIAAYLNQLLAQ
jgi:hypothetical protein|nr:MULTISPECIES: S1/P1 nuclease [unclassified Iodidimonas]